MLTGMRFGRMLDAGGRFGRAAAPPAPEEGNVATSSEESIQRTVTELLRDVSAARSDLLKADEVRRMAVDDFRKLIEVKGKPVAEAVEKLDRALKDQDNRVAAGQMLTMSDATGRPIIIASPTQDGEFLVTGSPRSRS